MSMFFFLFLASFYYTIDILNICQEWKYCIKNIVGKGENAGNQHFLFSSKMFSHGQRQKPSFNPFPNRPWFLRVCSTSLLKTLLEKEKLLVTSNFSFSHSVFYRFAEISAIFIRFEIVVCKLFQFGRG